MLRSSFLCSFVFVALFLSLAGCSRKTYLERGNEDAALRDAVRKITKNPSDGEAADAIPILYKNIRNTRLARIKSYSSSVELSRWDLIIGEYEQLQQVYSMILNSAPAFRLVIPESFSDRVLSAKDSVAEAYYTLGASALAKKGRANYKKAYDYFKKSESYVTDYKDAEEKCKEALLKATVNVVINPVKDYTGYFNSIAGSTGTIKHNDLFEQGLLRDLGGRNNTSSPARFYSEKEVKVDSIKPDWNVVLSLKTLDMPNPVNNSYSKSVNKQIQIGTDTTGNPVYQTVYATLNIMKSVITAHAVMSVTIKETGTQIDISSNDISEEYRWETESATFAGDRRALSTTDWDLINNGSQLAPTKDFLIEQLYKKILPRVRVQVSNATNW
jgi:hypothetical protein